MRMARQSESPGRTGDMVGAAASGYGCDLGWFFGEVGSVCRFVVSHFHFDGRCGCELGRASDTSESEVRSTVPYLNLREWPRSVSIEKLEHKSIVSGKHCTETRSVSSTSEGTGIRVPNSLLGCRLWEEPKPMLELSHSSIWIWGEDTIWRPFTWSWEE